MTTPGPDAARPPASLAGVLEIVRRRRVLALLPVLFVVTAAASLAFFLPSLWTARATILVNRQEIPETIVKPTVTSDLEARLLTLSQDILSRTRLQTIIDAHDLYPAYRRTHSPDEVVEKMRRDIRIEARDDDRDRRPRDSRSVAFNVTYTAPDPDVAARVTNTVAALYIEENTKLRERQAAGTTEFLEAQLRELRAKLQAQEKRVTDYKERYLGELPEQRDVNLRALERFQQQLQVAQENNRRAHERKQLITQTLAEIDQGSAMSGTGPNVTPAETAAARLNLLRQELVEMQTRYSDRYPDVVALREQIRALEARVAEHQKAAAAAPRRRDGREPRVIPSNPYIQSLLAQLDQANVDAKTTAQEISNYGGQIALYQRRLENTPRREQELALITRDYETTRDLFRSMLAKRGEAEVATELEQRQKGETFRVLEPAAVPERPAGPARLRLLMVGIALALGASVASDVLAEQVDTSYRRVDEVRASVPAPVLSTIPRITTEADRAHGLRQRRLAAAAVAAGLLVVAGSSFAIAHDNQSLVSLLMTEPGPARR